MLKCVPLEILSRKVWPGNSRKGSLNDNIGTGLNRISHAFYFHLFQCGVPQMQTADLQMADYNKIVLLA